MNLEAPKLDLLVPVGPFFTLVAGDSTRLEEVLNPLAAGPEHTLRMVEGGSALTAQAFLRSAAQALEFPSSFGGNWDALDECLTDLEWLPTRRVVLVLKDAGKVLSKSRDALEILVEILVTTAESWAEASAPDTPMSFHIVLQDRAEGLEDWALELKGLEVPFRRA